MKSAFKHFMNKKQYNLDRNPATDLSKCLERPTEIAGQGKFRALTQIEIGALWEALEAYPNETVRGVLKLQLLTGQRRTTPTTALQSAFQFDSGAYDCIWGLEDKSHHWRKLALPPLATSIAKHALRMATNKSDSKHLFPKQRPKKQGDPMDRHINVRTVSDGIEEMRKPGGVSAIIRNVSDHVRLDPAAKLTFEVSDGNRPMALYCASPPRLAGDRFEVALAARPSSCKPRDRWLAEKTEMANSCCGPTVIVSKCCNEGGTKGAGSGQAAMAARS